MCVCVCVCVCVCHRSPLRLCAAGWAVCVSGDHHVPPVPTPPSVLSVSRSLCVCRSVRARARACVCVRVCVCVCVRNKCLQHSSEQVPCLAAEACVCVASPTPGAAAAYAAASSSARWRLQSLACLGAGRMSLLPIVDSLECMRWSHCSIPTLPLSQVILG